MKKLIAPALLAAVFLTGCSPAAAPAPAPAKVSAPKPSDAQEQALVAELEKVKPELTGRQAIVGARAGCRAILAGGPDAAQVAEVRARFDKASDTSVSPAEAQKIIEIIKTNGFCTTDG